MSDSERVTIDDVTESNRSAINRTATLARSASGVLLAVGAVNVVGWLWYAYRSQQRLEDAQVRNVPFSVRVDIFAGSLTTLAISALLVGLGVVLRLAADYVQARSGGSVSGLTVGEALTDDIPSVSDINGT